MRLALLLLFASLPLFCQDSVTLAASADKTEYYLGEPVVLHMALSSSVSHRYTVMTGAPDRADYPGGTEAVLVDPPAEDPWQSVLQGPFGMAVSILGGAPELSPKPIEYDLLLNDWVRFPRPGQYRITVTTQRVAKIRIASNVITLTIAPPPAGWGQKQVTAAGAASDPATAGRILRSLDTRESATALVGHLGDGAAKDARSTQLALLSSSHRDVILPLLEARLVAPDQAVTPLFLDTLSRLADPAGTKRAEYAGRLGASLTGKRPDARVTSMQALSNVYSRPADAPAWLPAVSASLITDFRALPLTEQRELLEYRWDTIRSPAMLTILHEIHEAHTDRNLCDAAVRRIYELAPEEGRSIILAEIAHPTGCLGFSTLAMLPDSTIPTLDDLLGTRLANGEHQDDLILRYASAAIVRQVEYSYTRRNAPPRPLPQCGSALVYYFLKNDPEFGEKELRRQIDLDNGPPVCYDIGFQFRTLGRYAYSPALEKLAIGLLSSPKVPVKRGAVEILGKFGSAEVQKPLWETLEYFHNWWKDREGELDDGQKQQENLQLERALRVALAQACAWVLEPSDLNRLLSLCTSKWCKQETGEWIAESASPVNIFGTAVGHYHADSTDDLRRKLSQYPAGTAFHISPSADTAAIERIVAETGHKVAPR